MPAYHSTSTDQLNALRSGGFAGEIRFAVCPNTIVFQATVNQTITDDSFTEFLWDDLLDGDYADVVAGMTFFITLTDDPVELRTPLLRGRASQDPTGSIFYCNESGINLLEGYIVTVISLFEIVQKDRIGNLVDGWQTFEDLAPLCKSMQSFYYGENATEFQFSFAPVGQAMAEGATISAYHWTIAGAVYDVGNADTQNITVTVPYGHTWAYLDITDSNDTVFRFIFEILVCLRDDTAFMYMAHDNVTINSSIPDGWNVSTTYFAGVESLLNRTRAAIVAFDLPKTGASDLFSNVVFVGYFVSETTDISADPLSSLLSQTSFELQSFSAIAGQLPVPSLPVRNTATPDEWGDMNLPTSQRAVSYLLTRYSTLANLCAIDMLYTDSTWFAGEMDLEEGTLLDSVNRIGAEIQARLVFFPQGDATFEIDADFLSLDERDALPVLITGGNLELRDLYKHTLPVPYYKTVGQVIAGCATFYTDGSTPTKLTAIAPKTARQEGNEKPVILAQLLEANLTQADAISASKQRIGDLLEFLNPDTSLPTSFVDGWRVLTPSTRVWITYDLPANDSTRGLPISPTQRWLLQSVAFTWAIDNGSWDISGTVRLETRGGNAQQGATISPNVIETDQPILPALSDYDAFPPDGSLNYDSTNPLDADLQPYHPFDLSQYTPLTTEDAANAADNDPGATCALVSPVVNFSSNVSRSLPRPTVIGATYTATAKGSARIKTDGWIQTINFVNSDGGFSSFGSFTFGSGGVYSDGVGWVGVHGNAGGGAYHMVQIALTIASSNVTFMQVTFDIVNGTQGVGTVPLTVGTNIGVLAQTGTPPADGLGLYSGTGDQAGVTQLFFRVQSGFIFPGATDPSGSVIVTKLVVGGEGTNPFTGDPGVVIYGDAFYQGAEGEQWELYPSGTGLLINGSSLAIPPEYNSNSEYGFTYIGDGNATPFVFYVTDYSQVQSRALYIRSCGLNMGN